MKRLLLFLATCCLGLGSGCSGSTGYPNRPLTMVVPWAAGGGTDSVARTLATLMEQDLGKPINVVNRTGGSGVVGHQAIADAAPDGYTIGILTAEIAMMHHQGLTTLTSTAFTPLGLVNFDPAGIEVRADAPFNTLGDLLQAIRENPGKLKGSGTAHGGIWHVAFAGLLHEQGIAPASVPWIPSQNSAQGLLDLLAGGVDIVPVSHPEARSLIDSKKVKSLAVLDDSPTPLYPDVPTGKAAIGTNWMMGVWRGIGAPKGLPDDVRTRLEASLKKAYDSPTYQEFSKTRGFGARWAGPSEFAALMAESDVQMGETMKAVGLVEWARRIVLLDDRASGVLVAGLGAAVVLLARTFHEISGQAIGPALFPTIVGALMVLVGIALVVRGRAGRVTPVRFDASMQRPRMAVNFALVVLSLVGYTLVVDMLGFFLTASLLLLVLFRAFSVPLGRALGLAAVVPLFIHYAFYTVLRVPLPWGVLQSVAW